MGTSCFSLLRILADGEIHQGEEIARVLGLSRSELEGLAKELPALGAPLVEGGASDYRLRERVELYDLNQLAQRLRGASPALRVELLDECSSTSTVLAERAAEGASSGTVLACEHQSAGRGRRGNTWVSSVGDSVTFSILWRFARGASALGGVSLAVAVGVARALETLGARGVGVKWPNDLLCGDRKLGGILIETAGGASGPSAAVVGIGVNLRLRAAARQRIGAPVT